MVKESIGVVFAIRNGAKFQGCVKMDGRSFRTAVKHIKLRIL